MSALQPKAELKGAYLSASPGTLRTFGSPYECASWEKVVVSRKVPRGGPRQLSQWLSEKWDNRSSHIIIMLSGASVPPLEKGRARL